MMRQPDSRTILSCLFIIAFTSPPGLASPFFHSLKSTAENDFSSDTHNNHLPLTPRDDWRNYQQDKSEEAPPPHYNTPINTPEISGSDSEMGATISSTSGSDNNDDTDANNNENNNPDQHIHPQPVPPPHPSSYWQYTVSNYNFRHVRPAGIDLSLIIARIITGIRAQFPEHQEVPRGSFSLPIRADGVIGNAATAGSATSAPGETGGPTMMMRLVVTVTERMWAYTWGDLVEALGVMGRYADVPYERDAVFIFARAEPGRRVADAYFVFVG